jgi:hypothetical protein
MGGEDGPLGEEEVGEFLEQGWWAATECLANTQAELQHMNE